MLFGPIVHAELIRTARQKRWYVLRSVLGLALLFLIYQVYQYSYLYNSNGYSNEYSHQELRMISERLFLNLLIAQAVAILFLAPALTAGAIAEEKQRKTLHYLLSSRLTSLEIVVGKLASRLLLIGMPVAISLPIMVMLGLFGGIDVELVFGGYAAIASTALFEGSLAILISTLVRRGREALLLTFLIGIAWLVAPFILQLLMLDQDEPWPSRYHRWIEPVNIHLIDLGPLCLLGPRQQRLATPNAIVIRLFSMIWHQVIASTVLILLAAWQVRPAFRRQDGAPVFGQGITKAIRRKFRHWRPRRPCGDDPMLWKETRGSPGSLLLDVVSYLTVVAIGVLAYQSLKDAVPIAWYSLLENGYDVGDDQARYDLNIILRSMNTGLFCVLTLILAVFASTSISREREDDTWISLISTPLDGRSILTAKLLGCVWAVRRMLAVIGVIWIFGLIMGAFHPLGVLLSALLLALFILFTVALGTYVSLRAKSTMRAIALTFGVILFLSLGVPILWGLLGAQPFVIGWGTSPPFLFAIGMLSYRDLGEAITGTNTMRVYYDSDYMGSIVMMMTVGSMIYLAAGLSLLRGTYRYFDEAIDRPRRSSEIIARRQASAAPKGAERAGIPASRA